MSFSVAFAATSYRGLPSDNVSSDYGIIFRTLPSGIFTLNSIFCHCDVGGRPFRLEDFKPALEGAGVLKEVLGRGALKINHICIVTPTSLVAKQELVGLKEHR